MEIISSGQTFFMKRVFPIMWFGIITTVVIGGATAGREKLVLPFLLMPLLMMVFGFVLFKKFVWDLADEVEDHGDYLVVRKGSVEQRVALSAVMNVSMSFSSRPPRLTLRLRQPGAFGDEIVFIPKSQFQWNPFARNQIAESLMQRVDRLRNTGNRLP